VGEPAPPAHRVRDRRELAVGQDELRGGGVEERAQGGGGHRGAAVPRSRGARRGGTAQTAARETLGVNRRSVAPIVAVAVAARFAATIDGRIPKSITASRGEGELPVHLFGARDPADEAARVARCIRSLLDRGAASEDITILLRSTKNEAAPFLAALTDAGVPWRCTGREGLFLQPEAEVLGDLVAWLCGRDIFYRARRRQEVSIALDELLGRLAATFTRTPAQTATLRAHLLALRTTLPLETAADLVAHLHDVLGLLGVADWDAPSAVERLGVLARFSQILADFEAVTRRSWTRVTDGVAHVEAGHAGGPIFLRALADYLSLYAQSAYEDFAGEADAATAAVTVSTVHGATGLQWPVVFVPRLNRGVFPSRMTGRAGRWLLPRDRFPAARYEGSDDDERRLFYVAMTRARDHLYLSLCQRDEDGDALRASPLLQELLPGPIAASEAAVERLRVSYSALASYQRCPHQHWLTAALGFASPTVREGGYGRAVHHLLRRLAETLREAGADPTREALDALVAEEFYLPHGDVAAYDALERKARRILTAALADGRDDLARVWAVERPLVLHREGADIDGRADVILDREGGVAGNLALVDYKTRPVDEDDDDAQQLRVYTAAARAEGFTVRAAWLHDLTAAKGDARRAVDVGGEAVAVALGALDAAVAGLRARRFEATPGAHCGRCAQRAICAAAEGGRRGGA